MKKVIAFFLIVALALGGIGSAHWAVTDSQDELKVYPTLEVGDSTVLDGRSVSLTFSCADHLRWHLDYPFGGEAVTEFVYSRKSIQPSAIYNSDRFDVYFSGGVSSSVSGGAFTPNATNYGALVQTVADQTPAGGSMTMELQMSEHVSYYLPDYELHYENEQLECSESASLLGFVAGEQWYQNPGSYRALMDAFRFPVQPGHIMSVTVEKDDADRIVNIQLSPENGPELRFASTVSAEGVWFVPVFRDESGTPLPYESPAGHGIYFAPWKTTGTLTYATGDKSQVTPDLKKLELRYPLDEGIPLRHMTIDPDARTARLLTLEDGTYVLTVCDLETGTAKSRLELLPFNPADPDSTAYFHQEGAYLLFLLQGQIALTDAAGENLYLTAPEAADQRFGARYYDSDTGCLRFDGEKLLLTDTSWFRDGTFWTAAWEQDALVYYGEFDCSLNRGNDNWYYSYVTAEEYPITLK